MAFHMTDAQTRKKNTVLFRRALNIMHDAAVAVYMVRTREPYRAIETLRDFAFAGKMEFKVWDVLKGWQTHDRSRPDADPTVDATTKDPLAALMAITGMGSQSAGFGEEGVYVMMHPHKQLTQHLGMIQCVKEYARTLTSGHRRLMMLVPFGYSLPPELQDDVAILDFDTPSFAELRETFSMVLNDLKPNLRPRISDEEIDRIISVGAGMTAHEFETACARAFMEHKPRLPNVSVADIASVVGRVKTEVVKRSDVLELMDAGSIDNIGGLDNLKDWIRKRAKCFTQAAADFGVEAPKGIALIGPPGTGKSASSKAIASVLGLPLLKLEIGRVFQSLVGQSEERMRDALKMVDAMAPCVLMIDEADKAFQVGSGGDSGVGQRVLGTILTWMQETKSPVFMIVTANRTDNLPSEFLRKGRLDEVFSVTVPYERERLEIIKIHLRMRKQNPDTIADLDAAVAGSSGYVSSELEGAVKDAIIEAFDRDIPVTGALIAEQLSYMVPLSTAFADQFNRMAEWAENNARPASVADGEEVGKVAPRAAVAREVRSRTRPAVGASGRAMNLDG